MATKTVHYKDYRGIWVKDDKSFTDNEKATNNRLKYIRKNKALNGQAEIFTT